MSEDEHTIGGLTHLGVKWRITAKTKRERESRWSMPHCISCLTAMKPVDNNTLACQHPSCPKFDKPINLPDGLNSTQILTIRMFEAEELRSEGIKWKNIDQELVRIAESDTEDLDDEYWAKSQFFQTPQGKMLIVYLGRKGNTNKVQIFVKDELDMVTADLANDQHPKELLLGFTAYFGDGSTSKTEYK
jgi:hypothetical protein